MVEEQCARGLVTGVERVLTAEDGQHFGELVESLDSPGLRRVVVANLFTLLVVKRWHLDFLDQSQRFREALFVFLFCFSYAFDNFLHF